MTEKAQADSVAAIAEFRVALLNYLHKVRPLLDDALEEAARTREWLRVDRRVHWENEVRKQSRQLEDAQQALFSAQIARLRPVTAAEIQAVHTAKRALEHAKEKLLILKKAELNYEREAHLRTKEAEKLRSFLSVDLQAGARLLERLVGSLEAYTQVRPEPAVESTGKVEDGPSK